MYKTYDYIAILQCHRRPSPARQGVKYMKYMPAVPINQPVLAPIIAITLLMNLEFEYQLKVCALVVCVATFNFSM